VKLLLESEAEVNAEGGQNGSALQAASSEGNDIGESSQSTGAWYNRIDVIID
jgi:hypothetical protein